MAERVWFITGCSTGFGRVLAEAALERGDKVVATARKPQSLHALVTAHPDRALACQLDVTNAHDIQTSIAAAHARFGQIDVLVNNAGFVQLGAIEEVSSEDYRAIFDTNLFGTIEVTRAALPAMRTRRSGTVMMMSAMGGHTAGPGIGYYCATKFGMEAVAESLSNELAPLGIRVMIVEPGNFRTEVLAAIRSPSTSIADYDATAGTLRRRFETSHGTQPGDPAKAVAAIFKALDAPSPPLRLPLGRDAVERIRAKLAHVNRDIDAWADVASATDY
jgi:NAD(P)-dependent dehydrogenase (short-subunit alcohol dehydrogenase family)